ncbi:FAD-dependent oxidoreductase [Bosea sp. (in: a-proteobacteria)]|uniref:FAD-dependent oxidoreductase n=1 Tax=Bosea sp. (in: a-proteobacteria) TaxID=1871050 RepID=UPI002FCA383C
MESWRWEAAVKPHAEVVVVGGGIIGCALLYELTRQGLSDVVLLEKTELTAGTTWHSAGHLVVLENNPAIARINALSFNIYAGFEEETGESVGLHACGSLQIASTRARHEWLEKLLPKMQALGHFCRMVGPDEMVALFPLLEPDGLIGASWAPGEGYIDPSMATQAFARLAREKGAQIHRQTRVTGLSRNAGKWRVETTKGAMTAEHVVLATGMWVPELPRTLGISLPVLPAERQYIVTDDMPEVKELERELPILRDYDAPLYFRQERNGLIMGVHEPHTPYCFVDGIPEDFGQELLPPDLDRGEACIAAGMRLLPAFAQAGVKRVICGPTSRTVDFNGLMGPLWNHRNLHVLAGFSAGVGQSAGVARLMAEWIVRGEPSLDVAPIDVARFGPFATYSYMRQCLGEAHTYGSIEVGKDRAAGRPARTTPLYHRQHGGGAVFVARAGWECAAWFRSEGVATREQAVAVECKAAIGGPVLADRSARTLIEVAGAAAAALLARLVGDRIPSEAGEVAEARLALRGSDRSIPLAICRTGPHAFSVSAEPEAELRLLSRLQALAHEPEAVAITNCGGRTGLLLLAGAGATALLEAIATRGFDAAGISPGRRQAVDLGFAPTWIRRLSENAEAFEIETPSEYLIGLDHALREAAGPGGLTDIGTLAADALLERCSAMSAAA